MKKKSFLITLLCLIVVISCKKDIDPVVVSENSDNPLEEADISIEEAKYWFDNVMKSAKLSGNDIERQLYWKHAYESKMDKEKRIK